MAKLGGHCIIAETMKAAKEHGMKDDELDLVYTKEQKKEICYKCRNVLC
jgi:hypothetical protein